MSSTRRADPNAPLSQERYMSSPEFAELQAISGTAVAKRCALLASPAKRELLWFIQGLSLAQGGLTQLAGELVKMFPQRCQRGDLALAEARPCNALTAWGEREHAHALPLKEFLIDLCINPTRQINIAGDDKIVAEFESERTIKAFGRSFDGEFLDSKLAYFDDIIGALVEYKRRHEERTRSEFCHTAISRQIWGQLDFALKAKTMIVIEGREGRGKTEAVRVWCNCHLGVARFASLIGTNTKTSHFTQFARALGIGHGNSYKVSEMQSSIQKVLGTSGLMPVVDEAHFTFNQGPRMETRPEMLDWIDTALCNPPLPVALVTTPQFMTCMERAVDQVGWNYRQFKRRCKRYHRLPANNTPEDIEAVARHLLPGADRATIKQVLGYEAMSKRDLSAVGDVAREAKLLAEQDKAAKVTFEHVRRAIHEVLLVNDLPWAEMEKRLRDKQRGRRRLPECPVPAPERAPERSEVSAEDGESSRERQTEEREISLPLSGRTDTGNRLRSRPSAPALIETFV